MDIQNNEVGTRNEKQVYKLDMLYNDDIERAIRQTRHYKRDIFDVNYEKPVASKAGRISIQNMTTKEAIFEYASNSKTIAALNFASYKKPGGGFLTDNKGQEESLCKKSTLYNVLSAFTNEYYVPNRMTRFNRGLYSDNLLYSKDIAFFYTRDYSSFVRCDIITCSAPNFRCATDYGVTRNECFETLKRRIEFIYEVASNEDVDTLILGAWGCGAAQCIPSDVAISMFMMLEDYRNQFDDIIFAIPGDITGEKYSTIEKCFEIQLEEDRILHRQSY